MFPYEVGRLMSMQEESLGLHRDSHSRHYGCILIVRWFRAEALCSMGEDSAVWGTQHIVVYRFGGQYTTEIQLLNLTIS